MAARRARARAGSVDARLPRRARVGSHSYNVAHTYALPVALGTAWVATGADVPLLVALIWTGHIGADRFLGYGLKVESEFRETHLSVQPTPADAFRSEE